jgi:hypothetical protein
VAEMLFNVDTAISLFVDKPAVANAKARLEKRGLTKCGAYTRTKARGLLRSGGKKQKRSKPGGPPRMQSPEKEIKKFLYFVYDPVSQSVVVGPALLNGLKRNPDGHPVPGTLEHGGVVSQSHVRLSGGLLVPTNSKLARRHGGTKIVETKKQEPRPFMRPAFEAVLPQFAGAFKGEFNNG